MTRCTASRWTGSGPSGTRTWRCTRRWQTLSNSDRTFPMDHSFVTTAFTLDGYRIAKNLGVVRGITVRSRSIIGNIGAGIQTLFGGNISLLQELCERTRQEAFVVMMQHAQEQGANGIIGMRYDANEVMSGVTEVLAYGT